MYVLAPNKTVTVFPYSVEALRRDNPNTSFPSELTDERLSDYSVFPVVEQPAPDYDPATQDLNQCNPTLTNKQWLQTWQVSQASAKEIEERTKEKANEVRQQRNELLQGCDWTQLPDAPVDRAAWASYRQELRNVTTQAGFPWKVIWPQQPQ